MYAALGIATVLYIAISLGVFGSLTVDQVIKYGPTAVSEAARPALGQAGFAIMAIAALRATSASVSAKLYASNGFTGALAEHRQFPPIFATRSRLGTHGGLIITVVLTLVLGSFFNLSTIASVGSAVSLTVFVLVALAGLRLRHEIHAHAWPIACWRSSARDSSSCSSRSTPCTTSPARSSRWQSSLFWPSCSISSGSGSEIGGRPPHTERDSP